MNRTGRLALVFSVAALLAPWGPPPRAEVSVCPVYSGLPITFIGVIGEGSDPFDPVGARAFQIIRDVPAAHVLNPDGYQRGDLGLDLAWHPDTRHPAAVWSYTFGSEHDIAFSEWLGDSWSEVEFLTVGGGDDLDPRVSIDSEGAVCVTWWTVGTGGDPDQVYVSKRPANSVLWDAAIPVTEPDQPGRRPSVVRYESTLRIAYERESTEPGVVQEVVVARQMPSGDFHTEVVARSLRDERLDPILHVELGNHWIDWKDAEQQMGYARWDPGGWSLPSNEPWTDGSWLGVAFGRGRIRQEVLNP